MATLVERQSRFLMLVHLPDGHGAIAVRDGLLAAVKTLPAHLAKTLTWDQGTELSSHQLFSVQSGVDVYFCDPHSPWQRGSNENTNGLLRQYLPKGTDLSVHSAADLIEIQRSLNNRPRKTLGYLTPSEAYAQVVAATA